MEKVDGYDTLNKQLKELILRVQSLEKEVEKLKNGDFGTGVYLDGCTVADAEYITGKKIEKKAGE